MTLQQTQNIIGSTKYSTLYIKIIDNAINQDRIKLKKDNPDYVYYEAHHILPKSIFKEFSIFKNNPWNKVLLTAREHFICHILLMKHYRKIEDNGGHYKMSKALSSLKMKNTYNSKIYESLNLNLKHSKETCLKISNSRKGIIFSEEHKDNIRKANLGKKLSKETKAKMSKNRIGLKNCSKVISIFDNHNNLIITCDGTFQKDCNLLNLPFNKLKNSYQNNGSKLYVDLPNNVYSRVKNTSNYIKYKGWYAIKD